MGCTCFKFFALCLFREQRSGRLRCATKPGVIQQAKRTAQHRSPRTVITPGVWFTTLWSSQNRRTRTSQDSMCLSAPPVFVCCSAWMSRGWGLDPGGHRTHNAVLPVAPLFVLFRNLLSCGEGHIRNSPNILRIFDETQAILFGWHVIFFKFSSVAMGVLYRSKSDPLVIRKFSVFLVVNTRTQFSSLEEREGSRLAETSHFVNQLVLCIVVPSPTRPSNISKSVEQKCHKWIMRRFLFQALDEFMFVVNSQGKVTFVSDNVVTYLKYNQVRTGQNRVKKEKNLNESSEKQFLSEMKSSQRASQGRLRKNNKREHQVATSCFIEGKGRTPCNEMALLLS